MEEGWKRVRHSKRTKVDQPPPRDTLQQDGWSVRVEHTVAGFHRAKERIFLASVEEAKDLMTEMHSNGSLAVLAPINLNEKGTEISLLVQDRNGCMQSCQRFLHQLGDFPVQYQSTAPQGGNVEDGGTKQIVLSLRQTIHRQTTLGSGETRTTSRSETMVAAQSRCGSVRCAPSDAHCWTQGIASGCPDCQLHLRWSTACKWNGRRDDPTIPHDRGRNNPLPLRASTSGFLTGRSLAETSWLGERAFGVVTTRLGLAVRQQTSKRL